VLRVLLSGTVRVSLALHLFEAVAADSSEYAVWAFVAAVFGSVDVSVLVVFYVNAFA